MIAAAGTEGDAAKYWSQLILKNASSTIENYIWIRINRRTYKWDY